ncbi:MAG: DUF1015 domain-containing protein [Sarcina sp.]
MVKIKPFKAIRPNEKFAGDVAALPYDVMNTKEARDMVKGNEKSFLNIDRAEVNFEEGIDVYSDEVYLKAKSLLSEFIEKNILEQDSQECFYVYDEEFSNKNQRGIVVCCSIDDYEGNKIKRHEFTRLDKEVDRTKHFDVCDANTSPILLTYKDDRSITNLIESYCKETMPIYDFTSGDSIRHKLWIINDEIMIDILIKKFASVDSFYIADGHHRTASAINVGKIRRKQNLDYTGEEEFNYFLGVVFPSSDLNILDYNRVVRVKNNFNLVTFIEGLKQNFKVTMVGSKQVKPKEAKTFGMCIKGTWYELVAKKNSYDATDIIKSLDVSILEENVLKPLLGIEDVRTDERIDFVGGIRGLDELEKRVKGDMDIAFAMYPTSIDELIQVSDEGKIMPPKSTWFEPKLRSGLFIHKLK